MGGGDAAAEGSLEQVAAGRRLPVQHLAGDEDALDRALVVVAARHVAAGVELDPELLWSVVERWSAVQTGTGLLEQALERDPSASGQVHAARARAARPG